MSSEISISSSLLPSCSSHPMGTAVKSDSNSPARQFASTFLGFRFAPGHTYHPQSILPGRVLQKLPDNVVAELGTIEEGTAFDQDGHKVIELLHEQFPLEYDFDWSKIVERDELPSAKMGVFFASALILPTKCSYKVLPPHAKDVEPSSIQVIKQGWVYTGFKVLGVVTLLTNFSCSPGFSRSGFTCQQLREILGDRGFQSVTLYAQGFGNFVVNRKSQFADWTAIDTFMSGLRAQFLQNASSILPREFVLDPETSVAPLNAFPPPLTAQNPSPEKCRMNFSTLAKKVEIFWSQESSRDFPRQPLPDYFVSYLISIYQVFKPILNLEENLTPYPPFSYTLVSGGSSESYGKSLLIGTQLGATIMREKADTSRYRQNLCYLDPSDYYPSINHTFSKSKSIGYHVHQKYIEAKGFSEGDLLLDRTVVRLAMYLGTELFSPNRLIFLMNEPPVLNGITALIPKFIHLLSTHLQNPFDPVVLSSVLFVINRVTDEELYLSPIEGVKMGISDLRERICELLDRCFDPKIFPSILKDDVPQILREFSERILFPSNLYELEDDTEVDIVRLEFVIALVSFYEEIPSDKQKEIFTNLKALHILEQLKPENFLVADFQNDRMRTAIDEWECRNGTLTAASFRTEEVINQHLPKLIHVLHVLARYFDHLYDACKDNLQEIHHYLELCNMIGVLIEKLGLRGAVFERFLAHMKEQLPVEESSSGCVVG